MRKPLLLLFPLAALVSACSNGGAIHPLASSSDKVYAVTSEGAAFYRFGPQQASGPDMTLPRNTLVKLIRPSFGYSKVQLMDSQQQGYVASDDLAVASANTAVASATPAAVPATSSSPVGEQFSLDSSDPRLESAPEQLPPTDDRFEPEQPPNP